MEEERLTKWQVYIGVAVEDREKDSNILKVFIPEILPFHSGKLEAKEENMQVQVSTKNQPDINPIIQQYLKQPVNQETQPESISITTTNYIIAEYFNVFPWMQFPPMIRKGERVIVFKYADMDKYFWIPTYIDKHLRYGDVIRIALSNTDTGQIDEDNTYFIEIDTLEDKHIRIKTSNSDGEDYIYEFIINAKNNFVKIFDNKENYILLDSNTDTIHLENVNTWFFEITPDHIESIINNNFFEITKEGEITLTNQTSTLRIKDDHITLDNGTSIMDIQGGNIFFQCENFDVQCTSFNVTAQQSFSMDGAGTNMSGDSTSLNINTQQFSILAPNSTFSGSLSAASIATSSGSMSATDSGVTIQNLTAINANITNATIQTLIANSATVSSPSCPCC